MLDLQWQRGKEGERGGGRERGREGERLRITSLKKTSSGKSFKVFFLDFVTFFLWNVFLTKIIPDERISRPKSLPNKHVFRRHIYVKKKPLRMTFHQVIVAMIVKIFIEISIKMYFHYCFTIQVLIEVENGKVAKC